MNYFDHTATKLIKPEVLDFYIEQLKHNNYNPAARYSSGIAAAASIRESLRKIAEVLGCREDEIIVTSGATESINTAIKGTLFAPNPKHKRILITAGEHAATVETCKFMQHVLDYQVDLCPLNEQGEVDLNSLADLLEKNSYDLFSVIHVNNVLGTVNPIEKIVTLKNQLQPKMPIHVDAVQSLGKLPINLKQWGIQLASFSLHKIGVPKGIGLLYKAKDMRIEPLVHGGGQQNALRSGTENPALVATAAFAIEKVNQALKENNAKVAVLKSYLLNGLKEQNIVHQVLGFEHSVPHIVPICFPTLRAETLLNILDYEQISVSIGSACSSKKSEQNPVLKSLKLPNHMDQHILRISLDETVSKAEIDYFVQKVKQALAKYAR